MLGGWWGSNNCAKQKSENGFEKQNRKLDRNCGFRFSVRASEQTDLFPQIRRIQDFGDVVFGPRIRGTDFSVWLVPTLVHKIGHHICEPASDTVLHIRSRIPVLHGRLGHSPLNRISEIYELTTNFVFAGVFFVLHLGGPWLEILGAPPFDTVVGLQPTWDLVCVCPGTLWYAVVRPIENRLSNARREPFALEG